MANFFSDTYDKFKDLDPLGDSLGWHPEDPNDKPGAKPSSPDPYGAAGQAVQWDASGRPIGRMPMGKTALDWQYEADRRTELRKQALWGDAQNVMRQGTDLLQTYRAGGSAALASGIYQNRGAMYGNQAMSTESPDLLMRYREEKAKEADEERKAAEKKAEKQAMTMGLIQAGAAVAGAALGGVGGVALGAAAGQLAKTGVGGTTPGQQPAYGVGGTDPGQKPAYQVGVTGPGGSIPGGPQGQVGGRVPGGGSGGSSPARVPGGGGPGDKGGAEGLQSGSALQPQDNGDGPMSMFSSQEAAYNAMLANQGGNDRIYQDWAGSPVRSESTMARIRASRFRMQKSYYPA